MEVVGEEEVAGLAGSKNMISIMVIADNCGNHTTSSCDGCLWWQQSSWAGGKEVAKALEAIGSLVVI